MAVSSKPWARLSAADYSVEQWHRACLIHAHDGAPEAKGDCKLPVLEPDGTLNRNAVHAAASVLAGGRGGVDAEADAKKAAARRLLSLYRQLEEERPVSLARAAGQRSAKASANDVRQELEAALKLLFPVGGAYIVDHDEDEGWVVYERYGEHVRTGKFRVGFQVNDEGRIVFDEAGPVEVVQRISYVPAPTEPFVPQLTEAKASLLDAGFAPSLPMKAAPLDPDETEAWWAGKLPRRLLAIPFHGPIPSPDGKGRDLDAEFFDERTDIKPDWFEERPVDWHHSQDPSGLMNGVLIGKAKNLALDEDGWWVDLWLNAGERRLSLVRKLAEKGAELFGSSYAYPNLIRRGKAGHIDVWPYMLQTLSTSPQNTHSVLRPAKAVLDVFDQADIAVSPALRDVLTELDAQLNLSATAASGWRTPVRDLSTLAAKAGRELSGRNLTEIEEWLDVLEAISSRARSLRDRVRSRYHPNDDNDLKE